MQKTQGLLQCLVDELRTIDRTLADLISTLPAPHFEPGSDRPLNAAAALQGLLEATRQDEILPAIRSLAKALEIGDSEALEMGNGETDDDSREERP